MSFAVFPSGSLFDPETEIWRLRGMALAGGVSIGGSATLSRTDGGGLWVCEQTGIDLWTPEQLRAAAALDVQLEGGAASIVVPCFSWPLRPRPAGAAFAIDVALAADAALRATTLDLVLTASVPLTGGEPFSIVHATHGKRLYRVRDAAAAETAEGITTQTVTIRPPLREAATAGAALDFDDPGCVMRLANPEAWLSPLDPSHEQTAQPTWVEHFDRPA